MLVDASLELVITVVTWWSRSRFGSIQLSDNEYSILVHGLMVKSLIGVFKRVSYLNLCLILGIRCYDKVSLIYVMHKREEERNIITVRGAGYHPVTNGINHHIINSQRFRRERSRPLQRG